MSCFGCNEELLLGEGKQIAPNKFLCHGCSEDQEADEALGAVPWSEAEDAG